MNLKGSVAILCGAGRINGIGAATAELLAKKGSNVLINCIKNREQAAVIADLCKSYGVEADFFLGDVTKQEFCQELFHFVNMRWGRADILVNCLGITRAVPYNQLDQLNQSDFYNSYAVNVIAPFFLAREFQKLLVLSNIASIVNISSTAAFTGLGSSIAYAVSKGAENTLTLALARALSPEVRVNAICPGFVDSSWWEEIFQGKEDKYSHFVSKMKEETLLGRVLIPSDIANVVLSVIENKNMTGELIRIDSGSHIGTIKEKYVGVASKLA